MAPCTDGFEPSPSARRVRYGESCSLRLRQRHQGQKQEHTMTAGRIVSRHSAIVYALCLLAMASMAAAQPPTAPAEPEADAGAAGATAEPAPGAAPAAMDPAAGGADAAPEGPPGADAAAVAKAQAVALLREGNELAAEGDYGAALAKFQAAYAVYPSVKLLLNIGTSLRHAGRNAEAARTYERYLAAPDADPARFEELRRILDEIDQVVGWLRVEVRPVDARVRLDGALLELPPRGLRLRVDPGQHTVAAERPGYRTVIRSVSVERRARLTVRIDLAKPDLPPPVIIDEGIPTQHIVAYAVGGVGLGGMAAGAVFGILSLSTDAAADERCSTEDPTVCDEEGAQLGDTAQTQGTLSTIFLAAGGGLLATGLVIWLTTPSDEDQAPPDDTTPEVAVTPLWGDGPGVGWRVRW